MPLFSQVLQNSLSFSLRFLKDNCGWPHKKIGSTYQVEFCGFRKQFHICTTTFYSILEINLIPNFREKSGKPYGSLKISNFLFTSPFPILVIDLIVLHLSLGKILSFIVFERLPTPLTQHHQIS